MARTAALYVFPAALVVSGWLRLEEPAAGGAAIGLAALALLPALPRPAWARAIAALAAWVLALPLVLGFSPIDARPFDDRHDFFGPLLDRLREGFLAFFDVAQPFDAAEHPAMHDVALLAIFGFCLAVGLAIAARRPLLASAGLLVAAVWPATLVPGNDFQRGALVLGAVLVLLAAGGRAPARVYGQAAVGTAALVAVALAATSSSAVAKDEFVDWRTWDFYDQPLEPVGVRYVWDASYDGIRYPEKPTTVLTVTGPERSLYWRATTLDQFDGARWLEDLLLVRLSHRPVELLDDPLVPARARARTRWVRADVEVEALRDNHLAGPSTPVRYDAGAIGPVAYRDGGVAVVSSGLRRDQRYTVWAYAPRPTPEQLARAPVRPERTQGVAGRYLELVPAAAAPPFGARGRDAELEALVGAARFAPVLEAYRPLFARAREVAGRPRSPYAAAAALETWFRSEGGFAYDEQPPQALDVPPLVAFVTRHQRGYCQHYAGAMALMLRYLGIPARVAVGFTSGTYDADDKRWTVTDHNAHAWVEAWFDGWGWLPFDPTPARGQLSAPYTAAAPNVDLQGLSRQLELAGGLVAGRNLQLEGELLESRLAGTGAASGGSGSDGPSVGDRGGSLLTLLAVIAIAAAVAIAAAKLARRRLRYLTRDPRRLASACRRELVDFLLDQRIAVGRSATLTELARILEREFALDGGPLVTAIGVARFGPPEGAAVAGRRGRRRMRELRRELRRRLGLLERLRGAVSVRSLAA